MKRIRILAAQMPRMLQDMVDSIIAAEPDMMIAGEWARGSDIAEAVACADADILIVADDAIRGVEQWDSLLFDRPRLKVLVLEQTGRTALLYELRPQRTPLGEVSRAGLVSAIRAAMHTEVA